MDAKVIITFDDGYIDHFTAAEYLKLHSLKAVFSITVGWLDRDDQSLSEGKLKQMAAMGHMICNHSWSHLKPQTTTMTESLEDCKKAKDWLNSRGYSGDYIIMPFGGMSIQGLLHLTALKEQYKWIRSVRGTITRGGFNLNYETEQVIHYGNELKVMPVTAVCGIQNPATLKNSVDAAIAENALAVAMYHRVNIKEPTPWDVTWALFREQIDYIATQVRAKNLECVLPDSLCK